MNVYDTIKFAASKDWKIVFDSKAKTVSILSPGELLATERWQTDKGIVTPVTALIRAIRAAKQRR